MTFDKKHIDGLLDKYWEGASTLAEDAALRQYFASDHVHEEHSPYTSLFHHFTEQREICTDLQVETVLRDISTAKRGSVLMRLIRKPVFNMGIAASMLLMLCIVTVMNMPTTGGNTVVLDQEDDTEEALRVTKQALALLSGKINDSSTMVNKNVKKVGSASILK